MLRVRAYPKFKLSVEDRQDLLEDFLPYAKVVDLPPSWPVLPACRDKRDQMFLMLAQVGQADALITGDGDLLAMRDESPGLIVTPDEWAGRQDSGLRS